VARILQNLIKKTSEKM